MNTTSLPPLAERLKTAMAARNLSGAQLSKLVGVTSGTPISQVAIQKITSGKTQHSKRLHDIARTLGVTAEWLAYGEDSSRFPESGTTLVPVGETTAQSSNTDTEGRKLLQGVVPVVGIAQLDDDGFFRVKYYLAGSTGNLNLQSQDPNAYGYKVEGDSMSPRIKHGEFVVVEPGQPPLMHDEVLVILNDGRQMIKVYEGRTGEFYRFGAINENHKTVHVAADTVTAIHYVAGTLKATRFFHS